MHHRKGIDLTRGANDNLDPEPVGFRVHVHERQHSATLTDLPQWYLLGAKCSNCKHASWLDRWALARKYGKNRRVISLETFLVCGRCGNRIGNDFVVGKARRN